MRKQQTLFFHKGIIGLMPQLCTMQGWPNNVGSESEFSDYWSSATKTLVNSEMADHLGSIHFFFIFKLWLWLPESRQFCPNSCIGTSFFISRSHYNRSKSIADFSPHTALVININDLLRSNTILKDAPLQQCLICYFYLVTNNCMNNQRGSLPKLAWNTVYISVATYLKIKLYINI